MTRAAWWALTLLLLLSVAVTSACGRRGHRQLVFPNGQPTPEMVLRVWLAKSCGVGEKDDLERWMPRYATQLTPSLIDAFENGPPFAEREAVKKFSRQELETMQSRADRLGLAERERRLIRELTAESYSTRYVADYVTGYKSTALLGLGIVKEKAKEAKQYLEKVAANPQSTFQGGARDILKARKAR